MSKNLKSVSATFVATSSLILSAAVMADAPADYYDNVKTTSAAELKLSIHNTIKGHTRFPYSSDETDTWDMLESADEHPSDVNSVLDIYKNASYVKKNKGNDDYNREHSWPKSYGFPDDGDTNYPYTDAHHLFISNSGYNTIRSNKPFDNCLTGCASHGTESNDGRGGTESESNLTKGEYSEGAWQTWSGRQGDIARALMYMAVRYEGGQHIQGEKVTNEPDLELTDNRDLITWSRTGENELSAYMGFKSILLEWHNADPVDDIERRRNDVVFGFQGNRNPFIDHPEWAGCLFAGECEAITGNADDSTAPAVVTNVAATTVESEPKSLRVSWLANTESDLYGYKVYYKLAGQDHTNFQFLRSTENSEYSLDSLPYGSTYSIYVSAVDSSLNESAASEVVTVSTTSAPALAESDVWINEFHYDNASSDSNEFVEVAGPIGKDLTGWTIRLYNGNGGASYNHVSLNGVLENESNGFGFMVAEIAGIQNGGPDGIALINAEGKVVQFISYEGDFIATSDEAIDIRSTDVGVSESGDTLATQSIQLTGTGDKYSDFTWVANATATPGAVNGSQTFPVSSNGGNTGGNTGGETGGETTPVEEKKSGGGSISWWMLLLMAGVVIRRAKH